MARAGPGPDHKALEIRIFPSTSVQRRSFRNNRRRPDRSYHAPSRQNLVPLFELFGVDVVFSGHSHSYERTFPILQNQPVDELQDPDYTDPSGPIYVVTGGGGRSTTELDPSSLNAKAIAVNHIVEITLSDDELTGRTTIPPGVVVDEFSVRQQ